LVALLFSLQPVVRGWARYRGRLLQRQAPIEQFETLDSLSREQRGEVAGQVRYWSPTGFHRGQLLACLVDRFEREGWFHRTDAGWSEFDLEVYGSRWAKIQITTVGEYTHTGENLIRCRLRPAWTLPARLAFWLLLGGELLLLGLINPDRAWPWLAVLSVLALAWWFKRQREKLQRVVRAFLDEVAGELKLLRLDSEQPAAAPSSARAVAGESRP
jgi:hypothetical protein